MSAVAQDPPAGELPRSARAVVVTAPGTIEIREFPLVRPEAGWALLRMRLSGICGTDLNTVRGNLLQYAGTAHERELSYPIICGHENVGVVAAVGGVVRDTDGSTLSEGDRVVPAANVACGSCHYCRNRFPYYACERLEDYGNSLGASRRPFLLGGWSEYLYVLPGTKLFRVPDEVPDEVAVLTEPMAVTHGLDRITDGVAGTTVYVLGCGPLGACHIIKARRLGAARILAADRFEERLRIAADIGADAVLSILETNEEARLEVVRAATGGRGADIAVDACGDPVAFREGLRALRFGGTLLEAGAFVGSRPVEIDLAADICLKDRRVLGVGGEDDRAYLPELRAMAKDGGASDLAALVTNILPLERASEGVELARTGSAMKVLLSPDAAR